MQTVKKNNYTVIAHMDGFHIKVTFARLEKAIAFAGNIMRISGEVRINIKSNKRRV